MSLSEISNLILQQNITLRLVEKPLLASLYMIVDWRLASASSLTTPLLYWVHGFGQCHAGRLIHDSSSVFLLRQRESPRFYSTWPHTLASYCSEVIL